MNLYNEITIDLSGVSLLFLSLTFSLPNTCMFEMEHFSCIFHFILIKKKQQKNIAFSIRHYCKCPKILYTKVSDKMAYINIADLEQTAPEVKSDHGLHCLLFYYVY